MGNHNCPLCGTKLKKDKEIGTDSPDWLWFCENSHCEIFFISKDFTEVQLWHKQKSDSLQLLIINTVLERYRNG